MRDRPFPLESSTQTRSSTQHRPLSNMHACSSLARSRGAFGQKQLVSTCTSKGKDKAQGVSRRHLGIGQITWCLHHIEHRADRLLEDEWNDSLALLGIAIAKCPLVPLVSVDSARKHHANLDKGEEERRRRKKGRNKIFDTGRARERVCGKQRKRMERRERV